MKNNLPPLSKTNTDLGPAENPIPPEIPGYDVGELLGQGGMGVVWKATQRHSRREVALKHMNARALQSDKARTRFRIEAELAIQLEHPCIARVYDCHLDGEPYFYTMEWIKGSRLDQYVKDNQLNTRQIVELMRHVCKAVAYAHQNGIIHRDLKPSNILIDDQGNPHVLDFGLAKISGQWPGENTGADLSISGEIRGTVQYMSPEQSEGHSDLIDVRSDVYTLGVILYQLLTGRFPYDISGSTFRILQAIQNHEPLRPRLVVKRFDSDLEAILLRCLAKDRTERYQSVGEVDQELDRWLKGLPIMAKSVSSLYLLRKVAVRHRNTSLGIVLLAVIIISFAFISFDLYRTARRQEQKANELAAQWKTETEYQIRRSKELAFLQFLDVLHAGRLENARAISKLIPGASIENKAAQFLLDPNGPGDKEAAFRQTLGDDGLWFAHVVIGEDLLLRHQQDEAIMAFRRGIQAIPQGHAGSVIQKLLCNHVKARLYDLGVVE
jgi:serine/threonine protein kinase